MSGGVRLSDGIEQYLVSCQARGDRPATLRLKRVATDKLLESVGNILVSNVTPTHIDRLFLEMRSPSSGRRPLTPGSINTYRSHLLSFFKWAQSRRLLVGTLSPMEGTRTVKAVPRQKLRIPASKFEYLLDCAPHPRDRLIVAMGLYLFLRQSEMRELTVQDARQALDTGYLPVVIMKTSERDDMPVCAELDAELRRWLTWYGQNAGPLEPHHYLIPAKVERPRFKGQVGPGGTLVRVDDPAYTAVEPTRHLARLERVANAVLARAGYALRDDEGRSAGEGMHTLRRSGATALYEQRLEEGHDSAVREVQAMLHHKTQSMTERYLGISVDTKRRNTAIRGRRMFPVPSTTTIRRVASG